MTQSSGPSLEKSQTDGEASDIVTDARQWLQQRPPHDRTHSDACHLRHTECLVSRLVDEVLRLRGICQDYAEICKHSQRDISRLQSQVKATPHMGNCRRPDQR